MCKGPAGRGRHLQGPTDPYRASIASEKCGDPIGPYRASRVGIIPDYKGCMFGPRRGGAIIPPGQQVFQRVIAIGKVMNRGAVVG